MRMLSDQAKQTSDQVSAFTTPPHQPVINQALLCITILLIKVVIWTSPKACAPLALAHVGHDGNLMCRTSLAVRDAVLKSH